MQMRPKTVVGAALGTNRNNTSHRSPLEFEENSKCNKPVCTAFRHAHIEGLTLAGCDFGVGGVGLIFGSGWRWVANC
jgi:hypothetical protein